MILATVVLVGVCGFSLLACIAGLLRERPECSPRSVAPDVSARELAEVRVRVRERQAAVRLPKVDLVV